MNQSSVGVALQKAAERQLLEMVVGKTADQVLLAHGLLNPPWDTGHILLTRNAGGEENNPTPGYFNHAALCIGNGEVLEAQAHTHNGKISDDETDPGQVIVTPVSEFYARYPIIQSYAVKGCGSPEWIANAGRTMIGADYSWLASVFPNLIGSHAINCVLVVRRAVESAAHPIRGKLRLPWRFPDQISRDTTHTELLWKKE